MEEKVQALIAALKAKGRMLEATRVKAAFELSNMPEFKAVALELLGDGTLDPVETTVLLLAAVVIG